MTEKPNLKPCPFCGGEVVRHTIPGAHSVIKAWCSSCGASGPSGLHNDIGGSWHERWNTRDSEIEKKLATYMRYHLTAWKMTHELHMAVQSEDPESIIHAANRAAFILKSGQIPDGYAEWISAELAKRSQAERNTRAESREPTND